jgi:hypothetical protein
MENLMEMEYVINGEKYLITATKVEEPTTEEEFNCEECPCKDVCDAGEGFPTNEDFELTTIEKPNDDALVQLSITMCPQGMSLAEWLGIIKEYGVILTD